MSKRRRWTDEQKDFLRRNALGRSHREITELFNAAFQDDLSLGGVKSALKRYKISTGRTGRFEKGLVPWNAGRKGVRYSPATEFKKGQKPTKYRPVGSERIDSKDGYIIIKTADPSTWKHKHRVVWEAANGPIPKSHVVLFADQDRSNCALDNLVLVSRRELAVLNKKKLLCTDKDLNQTGVLLTRLILKKNEQKRGARS